MRADRSTPDPRLQPFLREVAAILAADVLRELDQRDRSTQGVRRRLTTDAKLRGLLRLSDAGRERLRARAARLEEACHGGH